MTRSAPAICPDFDPARFWQVPVGAEAWRSMADKYDALARAALLAEGPRDEVFKRAMVELSSRWPGSLREGELIGPAQVDARGSAAALGLAAPEQSRAHWTEPSARAVICWAALHPAIADVLEFRRRPGEAEAGARASPSTPLVGSSTERFAVWVEQRGRAERWPDPARLPATVGPIIRVRSAYLWLAARSGLSLPELNALLLGRHGRWDRRDDDPDWTRC